MIPVRGHSGQKVALLGLGPSGIATAQALLAGEAQVLCWDDDENLRENAAAVGLDIVDLTRGGVWDDISTLIVSPDVAHLYPEPHPIVRAAWTASVPVDNDTGLFFRSFATPDWDRLQIAPRVIAITGGPGVAETAILISHILHIGGKTCQVAGLNGTSLLAAEPALDGDVMVLALSSKQVELARAMTPDIGIFTGSATEPTNEHAGEGGLFAASRRLFAEGGPDRAIIGVDQAGGQYLANQLSEAPSDDRVIRVSLTGKSNPAGWSVNVRKGFLVEVRKTRQVASIDLRVIPAFATPDGQAISAHGFAAVRALGISPKLIEQALQSFTRPGEIAP